MTVPVLLLGFNRPDKLSRAMEPLRQVRPEQVFIAVDGPRADRPGEADKCRETQLAAEAMIDWPCKIHRLYRSSNLGCRQAVAGAIDWAFQQVEELIIIEDDCVLDPSFFAFCEVLLDRHRHDEHIFNIAAVNFQQGHRRGDGDYFASKYPHCWGWATWKRCWRQYTHELDGLEAALENQATERERNYWRLIHDKCVKGKVDSWAYRWTFRCWQHGGVTLLPNVNLVHNIGFDDEATHTSQAPGTTRQVESLASFREPSSLVADREADQFTFDHVFCPPGTAVAAEVDEFVRKLTARFEKQAEIDRKQARRAAEADTWARRHPVRAWWRRLRGRA